MINVTLYYISGETDLTEARALLGELRESHPHELIEIDINQNPLLKERLGSPLPLLESGPYHLRWPFTRQDLAVMLSAAGQRREFYERTGDKKYLARVERGKRVTGTDRFVLWLSRHYMLVFNLIVSLYLSLSFLAPVMANAGYDNPARVLYQIYSPMCHQLAYRSFFLFGEQPFYPLERAHMTGVASYEEMIGADKVGMLEAREFTGNERVGYKLTLCERDIAIYSGFLIFGLVFSLLGNKGKPLNWVVWILVGILPIAIDGLSQLPGSMTAAPAWLIIRESTPLLRIITGLLFGASTAWFLYPYVAESMAETRAVILSKIQYVQQLTPKGI